MSKKHFIALADTLRMTMPMAEQAGDDPQIAAICGFRMEQWRKDVEAVMDFCKAQNGAFSRSTFMGYIQGTCGPSGGEIRKQA